MSTEKPVARTVSRRTFLGSAAATVAFAAATSGPAHPAANASAPNAADGTGAAGVAAGAARTADAGPRSESGALDAQPWSAAELAATTAGLRALEEEAAAAGLQVRDGTVHRAWGITGVADAGGEAAGADRREELQSRVHQLVSGLGSDRARLAADCRRAAHELALAAAALRT